VQHRGRVDAWQTETTPRAASGLRIGQQGAVGGLPQPVTSDSATGRLAGVERCVDRLAEGFVVRCRLPPAGASTGDFAPGGGPRLVVGFVPRRTCVRERF
jgi:hypothetical protein